MKYKGIVRGRTIELDEPLPYAEGQEVDVEVELVRKPVKGSPQAILLAMSEPPHLSSEDVDALERAIEEGQLPFIDEGIFDEEDTK
jgi:hypothetical protein